MAYSVVFDNEKLYYIFGVLCFRCNLVIYITYELIAR